MRLHTLMILTAGLLLSGNAQEDDAKKELDAFEGTWVLVSAERDGKKVSEDGKKTKLTITGTKYRLSEESAAVIGHRGTFALDPAKKPKTTDVTVTEGPDKRKTFLGITNYRATITGFVLARPVTSGPRNSPQSPEAASSCRSGNARRSKSAGTPI